MKTKVRMRETDQMIEVNITSDEKPVISQKTIKKWQNIINNVAEIFDVPAGLIMKITEENMEVFLRSDNTDNPYPPDGKDKLGHGLYCETVIAKRKPLLVKNALNSDIWRENPDVKLNMISYFGLPINWHDGESFGTICVLDSKTNEYSDKYKKFLYLMQGMIEDDLELLLINKRLNELSIKDHLTGAYNRRFAMNYLAELTDEFDRYKRPFSIIMFDLDGFKNINDEYGHNIGDEVLKNVSNVITTSIRKVDVFARLGGDEFIAIFRETNDDKIIQVSKKIKKAILEDGYLKKYNIKVSMGEATYNESQNIDDLLIKADNNMYQDKKQ